MPAPVDILKNMAFSTWNRLRAAKELGIAPTEETITDVNLLDIKSQGSSEIALWKCPRKEETRIGIDWEWFIGNEKDGWYRYAVQAKKLSEGKYKTLNYSVRRRGSPPLKQYDILEKYAATNHAIPIYLFYNYVDTPLQMKIWLQAKTSELGCVLTTLQSVKAILETVKRPTFTHIYDDFLTIPLHRILSLPNKDFSDAYQDRACYYAALPEDIQKKISSTSERPKRGKKTTPIRSRRTQYNDDPDDLDIAPRRIMVIKTA